MKKILMLLICGTVLFNCRTVEEPTSNVDEILVNKSKSFEDLSNPKIFHVSDYFKIYKGDSWDYYFYIYDENNLILDEGYTDFISSPIIQIIDEKTLSLSIGVGTATSYSKYYDIEKRLISSWYLNVVYEDANYIVYLEPDLIDNRKLIAQNPFSPEYFYKEFKDLGFSRAIIPIEECVITNNGKLILTYYAGENYDLKNIAIDILK